MRLIDADAVAEAIKDEITEAKGIDADPNFTAGLKLGLAYINTAESIDAEPVRHGRWDEVQFRTIPHNRISKAKKCSECGKRKDKYVTWIYCPNCGAKMDEEEP